MKRYQAIARYYDAENAHLKMLQEDVPFFLGQLPRRRQDVLELAVGTARAALQIASAGHRVVGIDYVQDMLNIAQEKRDAAGVSPRQLQLVRQDALKLNLRQRFDWIAIFFNTLLAFTTLEELDQIFQNVRRHLRPHGRFWIDIFNPDHSMLAKEREDDLDRYVFYVPEMQRTVYRRTQIRRDMSRHLMHLVTHYTWFDAKGARQQEKFEFDMTCIFPRELELLVERNGMRVEKLWGNYDGSALGKDSPRMIARCVRN